MIYGNFIGGAIQAWIIGFPPTVCPLPLDLVCCPVEDTMRGPTLLRDMSLVLLLAAIVSCVDEAKFHFASIDT